MVTKKKSERIILAFSLIFMPSLALAYIDPGILTIIYQSAYALVFGAFTIFVFRPWNFFRAKFGKKSTDNNEKMNETISTQDDGAPPVAKQETSDLA